MRNFRALCAAVVLTFALTSPAFAGIITTDRTTPPQPPSVTDGVISTGIASQGSNGSGEASVGDSVTATALNLLQIALTMF